MFSWLSDFLRCFADIVPRPLIVRTDERCVAFYFGRWARLRGPGWYIHVPALVECEIVPVKRQTTDIEQGLFVHDKPMELTTTVVWDVTDALLLVTTTYDYEMTLSDIVSMAVARRNEETGGKPEQDELFDMIDEKLSEYGIRLLDVCITSTLPTRALKITGVEL